MKKNVYIAPAMTCVVMEAEEMIAASQLQVDDTDDNAVTTEDGFSVRGEREWASPSSVMDSQW